MKQIVCALVVLILAAPASAEVIITCAQVGEEPNLIVGYECTAGEEVRCFGLDLQFDNAETVVAVECISDDYYVFPGQFSYDGMTPSFGTCDCTGKPGALPGPNGVTIEMCSLYAADDPDHNEPPVAQNGLVIITVSGNTCITITENSLRGGGVVLADNTVDPDPNLPGLSCAVVDCDPGANPLNWPTVGKPGSWCCDYHAMGDTNGDGKVNVLDLLMSFKPAYDTVHPAAGYDPDADFNHDLKVNVLDLLINFKPNYDTIPGPGYDCPDD